jgi:hypothetical protein
MEKNRGQGSGIGDFGLRVVKIARELRLITRICGESVRTQWRGLPALVPYGTAETAVRHKGKACPEPAKGCPRHETPHGVTMNGLRCLWISFDSAGDCRAYYGYEAECLRYREDEPGRTT